MLDGCYFVKLLIVFVDDERLDLDVVRIHE